MIKSTLATLATVTAITIGAVGATTAPAQAGVKVYLGHGGWGHGGWGHGHGWGYGHYNPCRHWKRKYNRTGRYRFLRKYRRCMRRHY